MNHPAGSGIAEGKYAVTVNKYPDGTEVVPRNKDLVTGVPKN